MDKAVECLKKAKHYEERAERVGCGGISSDEPDCLDALRSKLADLKEEQRVRKLTNKILKKFIGKKLEDALGALKEEGITEETFKAFRKFEDKIEISPPFMLKNLNNRIKNTDKRIQEKEALDGLTKDFEDNIFSLDEEENRLYFEFFGKPSQEIIERLKKGAFKWSGCRQRWQRQYTLNALSTAKQIEKFLKERI